LIKVRYEPVGRWYESHCLRRHHKHTLSHGSLVSSSSDEDDTELSPDEEDDTKLLQTLDPKEWKVSVNHTDWSQGLYCLLFFHCTGSVLVVISWSNGCEPTSTGAVVLVISWSNNGFEPTSTGSVLVVISWSNGCEPTSTGSVLVLISWSNNGFEPTSTGSVLVVISWSNHCIELVLVPG